MFLHCLHFKMKILGVGGMKSTCVGYFIKMQSLFPYGGFNQWTSYEPKVVYMYSELLLSYLTFEKWKAYISKIIFLNLWKLKKISMLLTGKTIETI